MKLAQSLGAETSTLVGERRRRPSSCASRRFENVTQIVLGRSRGGLLTRAACAARCRTSSCAAPTASRCTWSPAARAKRPARGSAPAAGASARRGRCPIVWSTLAVAAAVVLGHALNAADTRFPNLSMIFLLAVVFAAVSFGIWPAVYASVLSFLAYNFFFIEPLYTFTVAQPHELLRAHRFPRRSPSMTSTLAGRIRDQAQIAVGPHARDAAALRVHAQALRHRRLRRHRRGRGAEHPFEPCTAGRRPARARRRAGACVRAWPPEEQLDTAAMTAARWALEHNEPAGADTATLPTVPWLFLPLRTARGSFGVVGLGRGDQGQRAGSGGAHAARDARRADGSGARSRLARARDGAAPQRGRDRAGAQHAARLDLARLPHAAGLDPGLGDEPASTTATSSMRRRGASCSARSRTRRRGSTRWCATCSP